MPEEVIDTLRTFGTLQMPQEGISHSAVVQPFWTAATTSAVLALAAIVLLIANMRDILAILPDLVDGLMGRRGRNLDYSIRSQQERDFGAMSLIIPFGLIMYSYRLFPLELVRSFPEWTLPLASLGTFLSWIIVRWFICWQLTPSKGAKDIWQKARREFWNFFVLLVLLLLAEAGLFSLFGMDNGHSASVMYITIGIFYFLYILRRGSILSQSYGAFAIILYLCALEFLPTAMLLAATIYL